MEPMTVNDAIDLVNSRNGIPHEDDWDLMEAANVLCAAVEGILEEEINRANEGTEG